MTIWRSASTSKVLSEPIDGYFVEREVKCKRGQDSRGIAGSYTNEF